MRYCCQPETIPPTIPLLQKSLIVYVFASCFISCLYIGFVFHSNECSKILLKQTATRCSSCRCVLKIVFYKYMYEPLIHSA